MLSAYFLAIVAKLLFVFSLLFFLFQSYFCFATVSKLLFKYFAKLLLLWFFGYHSWLLFFCRFCLYCTKAAVLCNCLFFASEPKLLEGEGVSVFFFLFSASVLKLLSFFFYWLLNLSCWFFLASEPKLLGFFLASEPKLLFFLLASVPKLLGFFLFRNLSCWVFFLAPEPKLLGFFLASEPNLLGDYLASVPKLLGFFFVFFFFCFFFFLWVIWLLYLSYCFLFFLNLTSKPNLLGDYYCYGYLYICRRGGNILLLFSFWLVATSFFLFFFFFFPFLFFFIFFSFLYFGYCSYAAMATCVSVAEERISCAFFFLVCSELFFSFFLYFHILFVFWGWGLL